MRVALVTHRYSPHLGGIERYVEELARGLTRRGLDVDVLTPERDLSLPALSTDDGITVHRFREPFAVPRYAISPSLARRLRSGLSSYDVVHAFNYHELVPLVAAFGDAAMLVATPFYHPPTGGLAARTLRVPHRLLAAPAIRRADGVICISHAEAAGLVDEVGGISERLTVIPAGVDVDAIRRAKPREATRPVVLSVGRLVAYKRVDLVIDALARLEQEVDFVVVGDGPEATELRRRAAAAGVQAHFAGRVSDEELYSWLRTASVVVTMSERESFGLTVLEAVTAGARVVASDIPAHRETATYGGADRSLFVAGDAGDADALTDAIRRSLRAGRPSGPPADVLSWDAMAGDVAATYGSLSQARSRSTRPQPESSVPQPAGGGTLSTMPGGRWLRRYRDLARAHLFVVTAARRTERAGVMRFVGRQAARFAGLHVGGDTQVQFRRMTYVVDESAELHTLVELYRDEYYSRAPGFLPRAGSTVVDVGANVGVFTLFHAAAGADVLALEPNHAAYERLTRAVAINGLESRVTGVNAAGGAVPGWGRLHLDEGLSVLGSVVAEEAGDEASERVEIVTLDELIARLGLGPIDLLKVDVEGAEAEVLRGARATLHDVRRVIIEYHTPALLAEVRGLLADAAFREVMAFPASGDGAGMLYAERD